MKKLFVTGAAGFIGSNFVRLVHQERSSYEIIAFDSLTYAGNLANLADLEGKPRYRFVKGDICDEKQVDTLLAGGIDTVVHFAAESHVDRSIMSSEPFVRTNIEGTRILLDAARKYKIARYLQVSTDEVYGSLGKTGFFTETTPLSPNSPYSASKAAADLLVMAYHHTYGFPAVVTRCSNNYGPYQFPEKLIPLFVTNLVENKKVPVYGDGMQVRDWIHVLDHCRGVLAALEKGQDGRVYNFGGECEQYNLTITKLILKALGRDETFIEHVKDRLGHDRRYAIDATRAKTELGWKPLVSFEQGLNDTIAWYLANENWWRQIKSGEYMHYYEKQYGSGK